MSRINLTTELIRFLNYECGNRPIWNAETQWGGMEVDTNTKAIGFALKV